jgi:hypothetical protein
MIRTRLRIPSIQAVVGYAANDRGRGIAYLRAHTESGGRLARVPFRVRRVTSAQGHEVGYGALRAVLRALREWGVRRVRLAVEDAQLVEEVAGRRDIPSPIVLPYVRLRCALNAFDEAAVVFGAEPDLTQRARAEAALQTAA